ERAGCSVAFDTTAGFEDTPYIQRINRKVLYDLQWRKPEPLVASRRLCLGVDERLDAAGNTVREVDEDEVRGLCRRLAAEDVQAAAISLLFSYVNTSHEERVAAILHEELGDLPLSVSHEVAPVWREYERASTTIADAYLKPLFTSYVSSLEAALRDSGMTREWAIMKSNGGVMLSDAAAAAPIQTVMSGPAAGMIASRRFAEQLGHADVLTLDMGGTSADVGVIKGGRQRYTTEYEIEWGLPAAVPLIDIKSVGAGGGSIAWIDAGGFLRVGPSSAGAEPGPACYGRGGTELTVTDANLLLGRLDDRYFLGGRMRLDRELVDAPLGRLAAVAGAEPVDLAASIVEIANENMANAIKSVSIGRGHDPRRFTLLAFGGAGPLHAASIARSMGIPQVIVPPHPGVFSALGILLADRRVDKVWTQAFRSTDVDAELVERQFAAITEVALDELRREGFTGEPIVSRAITMRYLGQNYEHEVALAPGRLDDLALQAAFEGFGRLHAERYGYRIADEVIELVSFKVSAVGETAAPEIRLDRATASVERAHRPVFFRGEGFLDTLVVRRDDLDPGEVLAGPVVIEEDGSTTLVEPGMSLERTEVGSLLIRTLEHA
ncbi:MAG: hydantoinase/oxoprolinase family protein, partial [Gaiellales bacterium]